MWLVGVVIRRYIDILIIIINFPYSTCIRSFFGSSILTSLFIFKMFFRSLYIYTRTLRQPTRVTGSLRSKLVNATALGSLIRPHAVTRCNLAVSDMYMRVFGKDAPDSLYVLLCRYIRSQAIHRYVGRSAAS